ncbi:MAG: adenylate/guanylate cyclase domain-containing protein [Gammaproteobacteria bacterium]|nr:adenylate/guanylate cyclase domain-containing protein [Gammaproteobacteria bacterium]
MRITPGGALTTLDAATWGVRSGIAFLACAFALFMEWQRPEFVTRLDEGLRDAYVRLAANPLPEERLVVVDIDEASLREFGPWPWPRQQVADLAEILLGAYGARAVALDIVFPEPGDAAGDTRLAALALHAPLALAQVFDFTPRKPPIRQGTLTGGAARLGEQRSVAAQGYIANHAGLADARCVGNIGYLPDADGVLRRTPAQVRHGDMDYPSLAGALLACSGNDAAVASLAAAADAAGLWRVPFTRTQSAYTVIPAAAILREDLPRAMIAGRYVLVGSSSLGLGDRVSTPLAPLSVGVMVHAASLSGALDLAEGRLQAPWPGRQWLLSWCVLSVMLAVIWIAFLPAWGSVLLLLSLAFVWLTAAFAGFARQAEWSATAPLWAYLWLLLAAIPHEWWRAQHQTRRLLASFSHYVAQPVLDEIVRRGLTHSLEPTLCEVTVLIADMENYTRTTSSLSLEDAATLTKEFLGCLTRPVLTGRGTLDKYSGDGLVAFWGAPLPCPDQADRAVSGALGILAEVDTLNANRQRSGDAPIRVRIGIESGLALVGDLGTPFRSTYTAVGDCINFASRLESAARDLPTQLVIGPAANSRLVLHKTTSLGQITLRGTQTTIEVFTVRPD